MSITTAENPAGPLNGHTQSKSPQQEGTTGVILFTSTGRRLFMNTEAQAFIRKLQPLSTRENGTGLIPEQIHTIVRDLTSRLIHCGHPKDCESIQVERLCFPTISDSSSAGSVFLMNLSHRTADSSLSWKSYISKNSNAQRPTSSNAIT